MQPKLYITGEDPHMKIITRIHNKRLSGLLGWFGQEQHEINVVWNETEALFSISLM